MKPVVCLPTRNEIKSIKAMIDQIKATKTDLFICDENSTDGTIEAAKKNRVDVYKRDGSGKGFGVRKAVEIAKKQGYDALVLIDCDCTYPADKIPEMIKLLKDYDMVIGVRSMDNIPKLHRLPNKFHTWAINLLFFKNLHDINSGLRAFKLDKIKDFKSKGFDIEAEMTIRAIKDKLKIKEIPIQYKERVGRSKIRIKDGFIILWRIIKERFTS